MERTTVEKIEIWKDINEYNGKYQISNLGRIRRNNPRFKQKQMILKTHIVNGYCIGKRNKCNNFKWSFKNE